MKNLLVLILLVTSISIATSIDSLPSVDFLAAGLTAQEVSCGGLLEVTYTSDWRKFVGGQQTDQVISECHYLRAPGALRIEVKKNGMMTTSSYDRNTTEYRMLKQQPTGELVGRIDNGFYDPFGVRHLLETVRYPLHQDPLCEKIKSGVVSKETEKIDNSDCIKIDIPTDRATLEKYVVWLDPAIGYNPRKIEFIQKGIQPDVILFKDYQQIGNGVWFPKKQILQYGSNLDPTETFTVENTVTQINIGKSILKDALVVIFPSGAQVAAGDVEFTVQ